MSYTILGAKVVTSRKPSQCTGCLGHFPAGTRMERVAAVSDGGLDRWSYCPTCREIWRRDMEYGDEIMAGDLGDDAEYWEKVRAEIDGPVEMTPEP